MFKNDYFIDLEVGKLFLSFLLAEISDKMFVSCVFHDKNQKPLRMSIDKPCNLTSKRWPFCH